MTRSIGLGPPQLVLRAQDRREPLSPSLLVIDCLPSDGWWHEVYMHLKLGKEFLLPGPFLKKQLLL